MTALLSTFKKSGTEEQHCPTCRATTPCIVQQYLTTTPELLILTITEDYNYAAKPATNKLLFLDDLWAVDSTVHKHC